MSKINWDKAPEGFDYWIEDEIMENKFHRLNGDVYTDEAGFSWDVGSESITVTKRPTQEWKGEGLPCAETVCEVLNTRLDNPEYERCTILWIGEFSVVYTSDSCKERTARVEYVEFRPIRTENEKAIEDMAGILVNVNARIMGPTTDDPTFISYAKELYKEGYKKVD